MAMGRRRAGPSLVTTENSYYLSKLTGETVNRKLQGPWLDVSLFSLAGPPPVTLCAAPELDQCGPRARRGSPTQLRRQAIARRRRPSPPAYPAPSDQPAN